MSAGNDDFIRRRICDRSLTQWEGDENFLHRRSLSQMWAAVTNDVNEACAEKKSGTGAGKKTSKENDEQ